MAANPDIPLSQKIAIVGIGCRFAGGVDSVDKLWKVLDEGRDCSSSHPESRYDASYFLSPGDKLPGKMYNLRGSFLDQDPYLFDRNFFKMSKDEACHLDPAVRMLLEVTWEALEDAGIPPADVRGTHTGVYIGGMNTAEYRTLLTDKSYNIGQYTNSGNTSCMYANRLSYEFDIHGPSLALDTACSSSLYAIHLASEALKVKQCPMAIAGGLNIQMLPQTFIGLCQANMVSPDGRSKSFDKSANGYGRGEGFGVLVLKTVENAIHDNDRIYAVIRGGALSNDGRTPGIIAPSAQAQRELLTAACEFANVAPSDITYAEAHGTGTALGDKTEATVLGEVFGKSRSHEQSRLHIGSIKSNLGHTEGAAGVAGMIKVALCFKHEIIPRVVHFVEPNPEVDFKELNLHVPKRSIPWPKEEPFIASCSSFGFGGSNACMILENAPNLDSNSEVQTVNIEAPKPSILAISAVTKPALQQRLRDWLEFLKSDDVRSDVIKFRSALYTAAERSQYHQHRIALVVNTADDAIELLQRILNEEDVKENCVKGVSRSIGISLKSIIFVFSGMGSQWWGMGRELMDTEPIFSDVIKTIDEKLKSFGCKWSLVFMMTEEKDMDKINKTDVAQPCICAVQIALVELWRYRGVSPAAVVGHSVGEVAAAYCAGLLTLDQAIGIIYHRGRQLVTTSGKGTMMAVLHPVDKVLEKMRSKDYDQTLDIAAINGPNQVVISGDVKSINALMTAFTSDNIRCVQLKVNNAFHSRQQNCLQSKFKTIVSKFLNSSKELTSNRTDTRMLSTVTGQYLTKVEASSPEYWWKNIRQTVLFQKAIEILFDDGYQVCLEIGPHQQLIPAIKDIGSVSQAQSENTVLSGSLVRPRDTTKLGDDNATLLLNHARLWVSGVPIRFDSYFDAPYSKVTPIPKYPWQRELCMAVLPETVVNFQFPAKHHPLLGEEIDIDIPPGIQMKWWQSILTKASVPWIKDHMIGGSIIFPAAAYLEISLSVARTYFKDVVPTVLRNVDLQKFMYIPKSEWLVQTTLNQLTSTKAHVSIRSCDPDVKKWTQHMVTYISNEAEPIESDVLDIESVTERCKVTLKDQEMKDIRERSGLTFGPSFQTTTKAFVNENFMEMVVYSEAPDVIFREFNRYIFHPALFDACLQSYGLLIGYTQERESLQRGTLIRATKEVPRRIKSFVLYKNAPREIVVYLRLHRGLNVEPYCDITIADTTTKQIVALIEGVQFQKFETSVDIVPNVWSTSWVSAGVSVPTTEDQTSQRRCLIIPDSLGVFKAVEKHLQASDVTVLVANVNGYRKQSIRKYIEESPNSLDIIVMQPLDLIPLNKELRSNDLIDLEKFHEIQEKFPLFWKSLLLDITDLDSTLWPRLIFITAGAQCVYPDEGVNPFMSHVNSLLLTVMHEKPVLRTVSVDFPDISCEMDVEKLGLLIHEAVKNVPSDEDILVYRECQKGDKPESSLIRLAPRVSFKPTDTFQSDKSTTIKQSAGEVKLQMQSSNTINISSTASNSDTTSSKSSRDQPASVDSTISTVSNVTNADTVLKEHTATSSSDMSEGEDLGHHSTIEEEQTMHSSDMLRSQWTVGKDASYLVTGGTSGFGLSFVKWLVSEGVSRVHVISRNSPRDDALKYFTEKGTSTIKHYCADISIASDVERVLKTIRESDSPPLEGIFHLATQYRDGYLDVTTPDRWAAVMDVKAYGALLLHHLTLKLNIHLKYFVLFSSIISMMSNSGQANYCTANNFLNSLCCMRRHFGLPATALCLGLINTVGFASTNNLVKTLEEGGMMSLTPNEMLHAISVTLSTKQSVVGIAGPLILKSFIQRNHFLVSQHFSESNGRFSLLKDVLAGMKEALNRSTESFEQTLMDQPDDEAKQMIFTKLHQIVTSQIGTAESIESEVSLVSLGVDSLLASTLSEAIFNHFQVTVSTVELINESTSISKLQGQIFDSIKMKYTATKNRGGSRYLTSMPDAKGAAKQSVVAGNVAQSTGNVMVCFPPTGAGPSFYKAFSSQLYHAGLQVLMVQLPGWEGRETEQPIHDIKQIVSNITEELIPRLQDRRFVLFGHSFGSMIAFETAHQLLKHDLRPLHMFLSGFYAPRHPHPENFNNVDKRTLISLKQVLESGDDYFKYVRKHHHALQLPFLDEATLNNRLLLLRILPAIASTVSIIKAYRCEHDHQLPCDLTIFGGKNDKFVPNHLLSDWKHEIASGYHFKKVIYEGQHMFILDNVEAVLKEIDLTLQKSPGQKYSN